MSAAAPPAPVDPAIAVLLARWEKAQDEGDFAAYEALYGARFTGVRRSGPRSRSFDRAGWLKDRKRMFAQPMQVDFRAQSTVLQGASVLVTGEQTFRSAGYEDRGQKRLLLAREADGWHIVREEMLASELAAPPETPARFVFAIDDAGPTLLILGRAEAHAVHGARVSVHDSYPAALVSETTAMVPQAAAFPAGPIQLLGADASCATKAKALRFVQLAYPHMGQVALWRGEDPDAPRKADAAQLSRDIAALDPQGFWAIELDARCVAAPILALPGAAPVPVFARSDVPKVQAADFEKRVSALPAVRSLAADERAEVLAELHETRFALGARSFVSAESISSCSVATVSALFETSSATRLRFDAAGTGLDHVEIVADLDADGEPEVIGHSGIGSDTWLVRDALGRALLRLTVPYFDCPC